VKLSVRVVQFVAALLILCLSVFASSKDKPAQKQPEGEKVDSGSFGVFMNGHRVGTETFSIYQSSSGSVISSEFKTENAPTEASQTSELRLSPNGEIRRYEWKELSPGQAQSVVVPNEEFLSQKWNTGPQTKDQEHPYLLPPSTSILDDYFFIHREVLAWKFLATECKQENGKVMCPSRQRAQFGTLDPHQQSSSPLSAEYIGREKIKFKGSEQEFNKIEFKTEAGTWQLWLDDQFKVMRMVIEGDNTEVIRD
jgi:hypothetical protein